MVRKTKNTKGSRIKDAFFRWLSRLLFVVIGMLLVPFFFSPQNVPSPQDFIEEKDVVLYKGETCILGDYVVARISNTKSMDPTLDNSSLVLAKMVEGLDEISVGDIIAYENEDGGFTAHRVTKKHNDSVVVKGDNNMLPDRYKVDGDTITAVIVGILY